MTGFLARNGRTDVVNVAGGMDAWERAGLPVRKGPVDPGEGAPARRRLAARRRAAEDPAAVSLAVGERPADEDQQDEVRPCRRRPR